jgi:hypothetical protein
MIVTLNQAHKQLPCKVCEQLWHPCGGYRSSKHTMKSVIMRCNASLSHEPKEWHKASLASVTAHWWQITVYHAQSGIVTLAAMPYRTTVPLARQDAMNHECGSIVLLCSQYLLMMILASIARWLPSAYFLNLSATSCAAINTELNQARLPSNTCFLHVKLNGFHVT